MADITNVTVTVTPPATIEKTALGDHIVRPGVPFDLNTADPNAAYTGNPPAVVDSITIGWGCGYPGSSQRPGHIGLTVRSAEPNPIPYDSLIEITASINDGAPVMIGRGWVDSAEWQPHRLNHADVVWTTRLGLIDSLGRLAATKAGVETWPQEDAQIRAYRILTAANLSTRGVGGANLVGPIQVSGEDLYTLVIETLTLPDGHTAVIETTIGIGVRDINTAIAFDDQAPGNPVLNGNPDLLPLPAAALGAPRRTIDRTSSITQITVEYATDTDRESVTYLPPNPVALGQSSDLHLSTAALGPEPDWGRKARARLADLAGTPHVILDPIQVRTKMLDPTTLAAIISIPTVPTVGRITGIRAGRPLRIDGAAHDDFAPHQTIIAGDLVIAAGYKTRLTLTVMPTALSGVRPMRWSDFPANTTTPDPVYGGYFWPVPFPNNRTEADYTQILTPDWYRY